MEYKNLYNKITKIITEQLEKGKNVFKYQSIEDYTNSVIISNLNPFLYCQEVQKYFLNVLKGEKNRVSIFESVVIDIVKKIYIKLIEV